jgi:hypothetical protein
LKFTLQSAYGKIVAAIVAIAILGFSTVGHYGASWDERAQISIVKYNFELITNGKEMPSDSKYYGILFNSTAEAVYQIQKYFHQGLNYAPPKAKNPKEKTSDRAVTQAIYERIKIKHPLTFLLSLFAYISVAGIVSLLAGLDYAWISPIILLLFPRFWGHSFFNPKDIPFAVLFTLGTWLGAYLIHTYLQAKPEDAQLGKNRITGYSILYGILAGLVTGTRVGGFFLLFFLGVAHLITGLGEGDFRNKVFRFWPFYCLTGTAWAMTTILIHPASWSNPVFWFLKALLFLSKHTWYGKNLFAGQLLAGKETPWYYLPQWLHITIPLVFQVSFIVGLILVAVKYKQFTVLQKACTLLVLLQIFFLPGLAILRQSAIYNAERQFVFIIPGIAAISATAVIWIYQKINKKIVKFFAITLFLVALTPIGVDMITIHPYEYIYFNRFAGGLSKTYGQYDHDYWGLSLRKGMEWINQNASPDSTVSIGGPQYLAEMYSNPSFEFLDIEQDLDYGRKGKPDYYLAIPIGLRTTKKQELEYINLQTVYPECPIVYQVVRQTIPLCTIKKCN